MNQTRKQWWDDHLDLRHNGSGLLIWISSFAIPATAWAIIPPSAIWKQLAATVIGSAVGFVGSTVRKGRRGRAIATMFTLFAVTIARAISIDGVRSGLISTVGLFATVIILLGLTWYRARRLARVDEQ